MGMLWCFGFFGLCLMSPQVTPGLQHVLPPGLEQTMLDLLGPMATEDLHCGDEAYHLAQTHIESHRVRYVFVSNQDSGRRFELLLGSPKNRTSKHFNVQFEDPSNLLNDFPQVKKDLRKMIIQRDQGPDPWIQTGHAHQGLLHPPSVDSANPNPEMGLADWIRWALQALILLGLSLLFLQWRVLLDAIRRVGRFDWLWLLACGALFLFLTLLGGSKVPGWINSHGYELLRDVLQVPPTSPDPHGQAWHALHGLFLFLLPRTEASVLIVQIGMAAFCIPLIYALVRTLFDRRDLARMSALLLAGLPSFVWYAFSEVRPIPGLTFSLLALCVLGLAIRFGRLSLWLSASLLGLVATQFYPVFMLLPLPALLLLMSQRRRFGVKLTWRFWVSTSLFSALWLLPALWIVYLLNTGQGIVGPDFLLVLSRGYQVLLPDFNEFTSFSGNIWFNHRFTPLILTIASVLGLLFAMWRRVWHGSLLTIFGLALLFTLPGLVLGGMNPARLQLAAQPFYVILAAAGLIFTVELVPLRSSVMQLALALLVCLSLIWHPGPIGQTFTPQLERRLFSQGLEQIPESALVVWPPHASGGVNPLPTYLFNYKSLRGATLSGDFATLFATEEKSIVYYRPSSCYLDQNKAFDCAGLEAKLELEPLYLRSLPARSDYMLDYRKDDKDLIEIGFFRLKGLKVMAR